MRRMTWLLAFVLWPQMVAALNIENAKKINQTCALCHGIYGQGTPGTLSPRLAGLPKGYLEKELRYYRDGFREYPPMVIASSITNMTDDDIEDISEYLSGINLRNLNLPMIPEYKRGDSNAGKRIFKRECKGCHRKTGFGKPHKGIPPVAGQYGSYLFGQMKRFQDESRYHDDDPDDETFIGMSDDTLDDIVSYLTRLAPHPPLEEGVDAQMVGMFGMEGMISMNHEGTMVSMQGMSGHATEIGIAGRFQITPNGDILLRPTNQDMRQVAGLSGDFKITSEGIIFIAR